MYLADLHEGIFICNAKLWELALCGVCVYEGEFEHQNIVVGKFLECLQCYN